MTGPGFPTSYVMVFFFSELGWEVIVRFRDIGGIVDRQCLYIQRHVYMFILYWFYVSSQNTITWYLWDIYILSYSFYCAYMCAGTARIGKTISADAKENMIGNYKNDVCFCSLQTISHLFLDLFLLSRIITIGQV